MMKYIWLIFFFAFIILGLIITVRSIIDEHEKQHARSEKNQHDE